MKFPYQKETSNLFGSVYRPVVEFEILGNKEWIHVLAYLDSGADITLLPESFIEILDIKIEGEEIKEVRGIGEGKVPIIIKTAGLRLAGKEFIVNP